MIEERAALERFACINDLSDDCPMEKSSSADEDSDYAPEKHVSRKTACKRARKNDPQKDASPSDRASKRGPPLKRMRPEVQRQERREMGFCEVNPYPVTNEKGDGKLVALFLTALNQCVEALRNIVATQLQGIKDLQKRLRQQEIVILREKIRREKDEEEKRQQEKEADKAVMEARLLHLAQPEPVQRIDMDSTKPSPGPADQSKSSTEAEIFSETEAFLSSSLSPNNELSLLSKSESGAVSSTVSPLTRLNSNHQTLPNLQTSASGNELT